MLFPVEMIMTEKVMNSPAGYVCAFTFKETLPHISIMEADFSYTAQNDQTGKIYTYLPEFTSLTSLYIKNSTKKDLQLSMFDVMRLCPNLTKLNWVNDFKEPDVENDSLPTSKIEDLSIKSLEMSKKHADRIIDKITHLKQVCLILRPNRNGSPPQAYDFDLLRLWQDYFSNIEKRVCFILNDSSSSNFIDYWSFIDGTNGKNYISKPTHIIMLLAHSCENQISQEKIKLQKSI